MLKRGICHCANLTKALVTHVNHLHPFIINSIHTYCLKLLFYVKLLKAILITFVANVALCLGQILAIF